MKFAYADPPYLGMGFKYDADHPASRDWDDPEAHRRLIERLCDKYKDGWALSLHSPALRIILPMCPDTSRVMAWVKPFCSFKPGVGLAYAWEPVIFFGGRRRDRNQHTVRDWVAANITLRRGLTGAKPEGFCEWVLDALNFQPGDELDDLFPGTWVMGKVVNRRRGLAEPMLDGMFAEEAKR